MSVFVPPGKIKDVQVPDSVPVDLRAKLMVCLIHLHVYTPLEVNRANTTVIWGITAEIYSSKY